MPKQLIWVATSLVALILIAIAVWPNEGPVIQRDTVAVIAAAFGIFALLRPRVLQTWLQKSSQSSKPENIIPYYAMGLGAIYMATVLAFPAYVPH